MGQMMLRFARCATMLAAACGGDDGDGNGPTPDGNDEVVCGDGTCTDGLEGFGSCPEDCVAPPNCGDGACGSDENCGLCPADCACPADQMCSDDGTCTSAPQCGDGTCTPNVDPALTEDCATCDADCGCTDGQVCRSWEALGLAQWCGTIPENPTRYCGSTCGPTNPLIDAIPGRWRVEGPFDDLYDVVVDTSAPTCDIPGHEAGDACVLDLGGFLFAVLDGTRLFLESPPADYYLEGQVLEGGRRLEYNEGAPEGPFDHRVWIRVEE